MSRRRTRRLYGGLPNAIMFIAPFIALYLIFVIWPVGQAVRMSLFDWDLVNGAREFIGGANYVTMLWGHGMTWSMTHLFWWRLALVAFAVLLVLRAMVRRKVTMWLALGASSLVVLAFVMGFHPGEGGFWYDPDFWTALKNTLIFTAVSTPLIAGLGLIMALSLQGRRRGSSVYQAAFFVPYILPVSVVTLIWSYFLSPNQGLLAVILRPFGVDSVSWLANTDTAMGAIIATTIWWTVGFNLVLFTAGLQDVDPSLYEAAALDGAGAWKKFVHVTLPGIRHVIVLVAIMQVIASFQVFGQVNIMTGGGPGTATEVLIRHIYTTGFRDFKLGYASAMSLFLFAVMLVVSIVQMKLIGKEDES